MQTLTKTFANGSTLSAVVHDDGRVELAAPISNDELNMLFRIAVGELQPDGSPWPVRDARPPATPDFLWSHNGEDWSYDTLEEVLDRIYDDGGDPQAGMTVWRGEKIPWVPIAHVDADTVIDELANAASECGEFADDYLRDVPDEARAELNRMLEAWYDRHARPTFFLVEKSVECAVGPQDIAEWKSGKHPPGLEHAP